MKRFLQMSRAPFFTAIIIPVLLGVALAYRDTLTLFWLRFVITLAGAIAAHASANLLNDFFDFRLGADLENPHRNPFSGGSPDLVKGFERPSTFLYTGIACLVLAATGCAWLAWVVDRGFGPIVALAAAGAFLGIFYTAPPLKLAYRGCGEVSIFAAFGILPVVGAYYVQTGRLAVTALVASLPLAFLITNIIWINQFPDYESDKRAGKKHFVVRCGTRAARWGYHLMALGAFAMLALTATNRFAGPGAWWGLAGLPFAMAAGWILHRHFDQPAALQPAQALTIAAHLVTGLGMTIGIVL